MAKVSRWRRNLWPNDAAAGNDLEPDKIIVEARARIIWGDSILSVREFLTSNGFSETVAAAKIKEFMRERNTELRRMGTRNILIGVVLTGAGGITLYFALPIANGFTSGFNRGLAWVVLAVLYGLWKLVKGIVYLVRPQSEHKSIPDIVNSDIID